MTNSDPITLSSFVKQAKTWQLEIADEQELIERIKPLVQSVATSKTWLKPEHYEVDEEQGFGITVLHEDADDSIYVLAVSWIPGRGAPPHNHGTWAVIVGVDGEEKNTYWQRVDNGQTPGQAQIKETQVCQVGEGDVVAMAAGAIHSVDNESDQVTLSFHVYGKNLTKIPRSQFCPKTNTEVPYEIVTR